MQIIHYIFIILEEILGYLGILIITYGCFKAILFFGRQVISKNLHLEFIRLELGQYLALGLELLVGKDIIASIIEPTWEGLGKLSIIILLRVTLTYFLSQEIEKLEHDEKMHRIILRRKKSKKDLFLFPTRKNFLP